MLAQKSANILWTIPSSGVSGSKIHILLVAMACLLWSPPVKAQDPDPVPALAPGLTISYVSEVPWPADAGPSNPLERWAKLLSTVWAAPPAEGNARLKNLRPELSWDQLEKSARTNKAEIFVVHGYELLERGAEANLEAFLTPSHAGKAAMIEFVILRRRQDRPFSITELEEQEVVVDRGGCGDLVYRWLDLEILDKTARVVRQSFAQFHSATSAAEAVLAVYFGDAYACVVTREAYAEVLRTNPKGLGALEVASTSPALLRHFIACRRNLQPAVRRELVQAASGISLQYRGNWNLAVPAREDLETLNKLVARWSGHFKETIPAAPAAAAARPASAQGNETAKRREP